MHSQKNEALNSAGLLRQFAAMFYDAFLVIALEFFAVAILLPFNRGEAIDNSPLFNLYLVLVWFTYYAWSWRKSGQTIGMRAWKIRIVSEFGGNPSWGIGYLRLCFALLSAACFGLGYWWRLFTPTTWHDRLSQTRIVRVAPAAGQSPPAGSGGDGSAAQQQE